MNRLPAVAAVLVLAAGCATHSSRAQPRPNADPEVGSLSVLGAGVWPGPGQSISVTGEWERGPTPNQLFGFYPERSLRHGLSGEATIRCTLDGQGHPRGCQILSEAPVGAGFGPQGRKALTYFKARSTTPDGRSVAGSSVEVVFRFQARGGR